jgi:O-antigen biosynthesis protein
MNISVIICAYNEKRWDTLVAAITSLQQQSRCPDEIVLVIDNNPALASRARTQFTGVTIIKNQGPRGLSQARNLGIEHASGDIIAFIDDDAIADKNWLMHLTQRYSDKQVVGVGGYVRSAWLGKRPTWFPEEFDWVVGCSYRGLPSATCRVRNFIGCNMSFRRDVLVEAGGFDRDLGRVNAHPVGCEETELCIRIQQLMPDGVLLYEPSAQVQHIIAVSREDWQYFLSRCFFEGRSKAKVTRLIGSDDGLSSERNYTMQTLPSGMLHGLRDTFAQRNLHGVARSGAIFVGFVSTVSGYVSGAMKA